LSHEVVVSATFQLDNGDVDEGRTALREIVSWRRAHQPGGQNCGSVFVNPEGAAAGQLIDACGLRGHRIGSAEVSPKHANFIQADPDGSAADVIALICEVADVVSAQQHYALKTELRVLCDHPANLPALLGSVTP
jgi:UDP-N-acetylmuramate dehydrogenase